jgi:hypothetical protein
MLHDEGNPPPKRARGATGLACVVCHRPSAKRVRVLIEHAGKTVADEDADLCERCWTDRFQTRAVIGRLAP